MSDEIFNIIEEMEIFDKIDMLESKVDMLRSEVDTIGNVLLQVLHGTLAITPAVQLKEEE